MSDHQQNRDTYSRQPYNKNALLSASVTGLTFDDFTNKAIIFPAAALPPKLPEHTDTEPKKPAIFGSEPAVLDTETFSEISLDQSSDLEPYPAIPNPLPDDQFITETQAFKPTIQATNLTASLSQLPSVASSVFSTFSNILRGNSPTPTAYDQQQQIESYNQPPSQLSELQLIDNTYQAQDPSAPVVEPTFYATNEPAFLSAPTISPPTLNSSSGNAYRLASKKKLYAPAPGLIHTQEAPTIPKSGFHSNVPPLPQPSAEPQLQVRQLPSHQDTNISQPASQSSKFSLTSFFSTPILEKITGSSGTQIQEPHSQPTASTDIFTVPSSTPAAPVSFVNPSLFNANPVASNIQSTFHPEQQQSAAATIFNPIQSTGLISDQQNFNFHIQVASVRNTIPSVPQTAAAISGPPSGTTSNYRLRGKPHYKIPSSATASNPALVTPFSPVVPQAAPSVEIFNPGHSEIVTSGAVETISPILSTQPTDSTASLHTTQQAPATISFFNQPQPRALSDSQNVFNNSLNNPFLPPPSTNWNNSANCGFQSQAPITFISPVEQFNQLQQPNPVQQSDQSQQRSVFQPFVQFGESASKEQDLFQKSDIIQQSGQVLQPLAAQQLSQAQPPNQVQQLSPAQPPNQVQQLDQVRPPSQPSQLLQFGQGPLSFGQEDSQFQPPGQSQNILQVQQTADQLNQLQQQKSSQQPTYFTPCHVEEIQTQSVHQYFEPTLSSASVDSNVQPQNQPTNFEFNQYVTHDYNIQLADLDFNKDDKQRVDPPLFGDHTEAKQYDDVNVSEVGTENVKPTTFDNFFDQKVTTQEHLHTTPQVQQQPIAPSSSTRAFFETSSNASHADWFHSQSVTESQIDQSDINSNIQTHSDTATIGASDLININNNQTSPDSSQPNYFQIQNFFNNPPLIADSKEQDRNFNFIENNLINKRLHNLTHKASTETDGGSISSNVVEPPSSAQSELSEVAEINTETTTYEFIVEGDQITEPETIDMSKSGDQSNGSTCSAAPEMCNVVYRPVYKHWFFNKSTSDQKTTWVPFPMDDSLRLEDAFSMQTNQFVTTNGGRYDVNIEFRTRSPIYWNGPSEEVRRCSWFYKGTDSRLVPYEESVSDLLEETFKISSQTGEWNRKVHIPNGEVVIFQAPSVMVHFLASQTPDAWPNTSMPQPANRPRVVKRGVDEFNIEDGEPEQVDHLLFMVHGIGAGCDLKFRSVEEVVEDFRAIALQLTQSHYRSSCDRGEVGRIEILPVSWHAELHSEESGIDEKLKAITLESIPKLRTFTNDTLLDILFYSSPVFCQKIMDTVAGTINQMFTKYCERNPNFKGNVSLAGHSLGSLILFDLLQNQRDSQFFDTAMDADANETVENSDEATGTRPHKPLSRTKSKKINYTIGTAGTGQPFINYPQLVFKPKKFFALGSPIGMFVTIRGVENLGLNYKLPTTDGFYNIFHPYDPVAYRIEALVNSELISSRPVLIPHHKGRKRMHLELRETMARVGADIKQKIIDTFKSVYNFASLQKNDQNPKSLEQEVNKVLEQQLALESPKSQRTRSCSSSTNTSDNDSGESEFALGVLNEGKRIDYVLQEAPLEFFNEYLFALTSHVCYWDSADTILFIVKEIYLSLGMQTDGQVPQQSMTIERPISTSPMTPTES